MVQSRAVCLKQWVVGVPDAEKDFGVITTEVDMERALEARELILEAAFWSMDPYMRGRMREIKPGQSYTDSFTLGAPIDGYLLARVIKSGGPDFKEGDLVHGILPWAERFLYKYENIGWPLIKVEPAAGVPTSYYLGSLGMPGLTAWMGLHKVCKPKAGETLFVSAGSGAVGQMVGQLGKRLGLYVVGSAGSDEKVRLMKEKFGYDAAFNYKTCGDMVAALKQHCPKGIDCYYDNVGAETLDAVLVVANRFCRIAACGCISIYNIDETEKIPGLKNTAFFVMKSITLQGFIVGDLIQEFGMAEAIADLNKGVLDGSINVVDDLVKAPISEAPKVYLKMLSGNNVGKQVMEVDHSV
eukprot:Protomagalhaensia_wolfi_Nauph_80__1393@NODE_1836_length_1315_cov_465_467085_g1436_i0_p1_GENE_NODE_1836_length_1315_cov_465_467085_g1436_i0NODE_1836_length_1315_cov_465_467085_g1436_i0_p1_ORF_typecomplete_len355_score77_49ADH_N_2/PF16884_5/1_4e25ADH_N_2/PF16884_5/3_9e03ADH_zinc_N/PF00107_26/1_3e20ADH_zinc_N_2/PF13602_6/1_8e04ADH_zinc_N_2/PF13602_6/0_00017_NODE_1836_length_1315_cov_465_467085_g1436_i01031167